MNVCELCESADVEMYFYGEFDPLEAGRVAMHLRDCENCRQRLDDLHAIRRALAAHPIVDTPPAGDWSGFMRRLDQAVASSADGPNLRPVEPRHLRTVLAFAALIALVTLGVVMALRARPGLEEAARVAVTGPAGVPAVEASVPADRALREGSAEHLERSKLVVLGLATRDPHARAEDWQYERTLAGSLLSDTRLYRQAALRDGASDVARVMRDLETVLLEASMSESTDRAALERVQRLIEKRDLVVKMQVVAASGPAGN